MWRGSGRTWLRRSGIWRMMGGVAGLWAASGCTPPASPELPESVWTDPEPYIGPASALDDTREALWLPEGHTHHFRGLKPAERPLNLRVVAGGDCEATLLAIEGPECPSAGKEQRFSVLPANGWVPVTLDVCSVSLQATSACGAGVAIERWSIPSRFVSPIASPPPSSSAPPTGWWAGWLARLGWRTSEARVAQEGGTAPQGPSSSRDPRPPLILITIDTLRPDYLKAYGDPQELAPNISALAASGATYLRARAHSPWTGPSVASLMTGRMSAGLERMAELAPMLPTLAETLNAAGYRTIAAVNNPRLAADTGMNRGFERYRSFGEDSELIHALPELLAHGHDPARPTFLWVHLLGPHLPFEPADEDLQVAGWDPSLGNPTYEEGEIIKPESAFTPEDRRKYRLLYRADIHLSDRLFGKALEIIEGVLPGASVILTSDHGEELWEHGAHGHGHAFWRELLAVPLIVRGPLWTAGSRIPDLVRLCEVTPTFLKLAGVEKPPTMRCDSLVDLDHTHVAMAGNPLKGERLVTAEGVDWKLFRQEAGPPVALYRVAEGERVDHQAQQPEVVKALSGDAEAFIGRSRALLGPLHAVVTLTGSTGGQVEVTLESKKPLKRVSQRPPGRHGVVKVQNNGTHWRITGKSHPPDGDRVIFEVELEMEAEVTATVRVDGKPVPAEQWRVGGLPVSQGPFVLLTDQEGWRGDARPGDAVWVDFWSRPRGEPPPHEVFSEESLARLRALGYVQ